MNAYNSRIHSMSFYLKESLRKDLHAYAGELEDQLHGSWLLHSARQGEQSIAPDQFDAWVTLDAWLEEGEPVGILLPGGSQEEPDGQWGRRKILSSPLKDEAMAFRLGERDDWIVLARHTPADKGSAARGEKARWGYSAPTLSCVWNILGVAGAAALPINGLTCWDQLEWPVNPAVDPIHLHPRVLTKRVRTTFESSMKAALRTFSTTLNTRSVPFGEN